MSVERTRRRERPRSYEDSPDIDIREKTLDELTTLYVQDKISLEQYESFAAEIQKAADPQAVLRSALMVRGVSDADGRTERERQDGEHFSEGIPLCDRSRPTSPATGRSLDSSFGQWGMPGDFFLCIMGERRIDGRVLEGKAASSVTLMGSTTIDLRGIQVPPSGLRLELVAIMGEIKVLVSPDTRVHFSVVPIMGEAASRAEVPYGASSEGALRVSGIALMGSVSVHVVP